MGDHQPLIARLQAASGGDRELDAEIMAIFYARDRRYIGCTCWDDEHDTCCPGARHLDSVWVDPATDKWVTTAADGFEFTGSLDRALALAERVTPPARQLDIEGSWEPNDKGVWPAWSVRWYPDGVQRDGKSWHAAVGSGSTPALALCIALLRALNPNTPEKTESQTDG